VFLGRIELNVQGGLLSALGIEIVFDCGANSYSATISSDDC